MRNFAFVWFVKISFSRHSSLSDDLARGSAYVMNTSVFLFLDVIWGSIKYLKIASVIVVVTDISTAKILISIPSSIGKFHVSWFGGVMLHGEIYPITLFDTSYKVWIYTNGCGFPAGFFMAENYSPRLIDIDAFNTRLW